MRLFILFISLCFTTQLCAQVNSVDKIWKEPLIDPFSDDYDSLSSNFDNKLEEYFGSYDSVIVEIDYLTRQLSLIYVLEGGNVHDRRDSIMHISIDPYEKDTISIKAFDYSGHIIWYSFPSGRDALYTLYREVGEEEITCVSYDFRGKGLDIREVNTDFKDFYEGKNEFDAMTIDLGFIKGNWLRIAKDTFEFHYTIKELYSNSFRCDTTISNGVHGKIFFWGNNGYKNSKSFSVCAFDSSKFIYQTFEGCIVYEADFIKLSDDEFILDYGAQCGRYIRKPEED